MVSACMLSACQSTKPAITAEQCSHTDWYEQGQKDGKFGAYPYEYSHYAKHCPLASQDIKAWGEGRVLGLKTYCTKANAYELGRRGLELRQICPEEGLLEIQQSHSLGFEQYYRIQRLHDWDWGFAPYYHHPYYRFGWW